MKRINLTEIVLLLLVVSVSILSVKECSSKRMYRRLYNSEISISTNLDKQITLEKEFYYRVSDNLKERLAESGETIDSITRLYSDEKAKVDEYTSDTLYALFKGSHELTGTLYDIDSTLLLEAENTKLERIECIEVNTQLETELDFLNRSLEEVLTLNNERLDECFTARMSLEGELKGKDAELKETKKKVWANRGIAGGIGLIALLILL